MRWIHILLSLSLVVVTSTQSVAQQKDPHFIYEQGCGGCHNDHASDFAFARLEFLEDTLVISSSGRPLRDFLNDGHGGISPEDVEVLLKLLNTIRRSDRLFETKCGICHDRAKDVARLKLVIRDGRLVGRYTQRDIEAFLEYHGRLKPEEIPVILEMFEYQVLTKPNFWQ